MHACRYIWEVVSHEVGHTLGLNHDSTTTSTTAYYAGNANSSYFWCVMQPSMLHVQPCLQLLLEASPQPACGPDA
jgi:hypothetical protein